MKALIIVAALVLAGCKIDSDSAGNGGSANVAMTGKPGSGFYCITSDGMKNCTIDDSGMGPPRPTPEPHGSERNRQGGALN
jgi:hypothetical protein